MADFTISGELASRLEAAATQKQVSVEQLISDLLEQADQKVSRRDDPIVGIFDSGDEEFVARHEDILNDEWRPD